MLCGTGGYGIAKQLDPGAINGRAKIGFPGFQGKQACQRASFAKRCLQSSQYLGGIFSQ
jgi:hypothetical protein